LIVAAIAVALASGLTVTAVRRQGAAERAGGAAVATAAAASTKEASAKGPAAQDELARSEAEQEAVEELVRRSEAEQAAIEAERVAAAERAKENRRREVDQLVDAARKASGAARLRALTQLRQLGAESRIPAAEAYGPLLASRNCDVRKAAAVRLGELGDKAALNPLRTLAQATREVDEGYLFKRRAPECGAAEAAAAVARIERQSARRAAK
jgi:ribosomal protein L17